MSVDLEFNVKVPTKVYLLLDFQLNSMELTAQTQTITQVNQHQPADFILLILLEEEDVEIMEKTSTLKLLTHKKNGIGMLKILLP